jgi:thioredoxin 1
MLSITDADFNEIISNKQLVVVDCFAPWCKPCHLLAPTLEKVAEQVQDVQFYKLNVDENTCHSDYNIGAIPTLLFFKEGKEIKRMVGLHGEEVLVELVEALK